MKELLEYESPSVDIIELRCEGHLLQMSQIPDYQNGGDPFATLLP